jgi:hypothetical protein
MSCLNVKLTVRFSSFSKCDKSDAMKKIKGVKKVKEPGLDNGLAFANEAKSTTVIFWSFFELIGANWS